MRALIFKLVLFCKNKKVLLLNLLFICYMNFIILNLKNVNYNITSYFNITFKLIGYYLFIALINGFLIGNTEINNSCKDIFNVINNARKTIINQKLIIGLFISFIVWFIEILILLFIALSNKDNLGNILGQFISTLIFILMPIVIATFIGIFIGDNFKKEKAYSILTIIWLLITPLNEIFYNTISYYLNKPTLRWNFTLGSLHMNSFDGILGSHLYDYEIAKIFIFLAILFFIYNFCYLKNKKLYSITFIIILFSLCNINNNKYNISDAMMFQRTGDFYSMKSNLDLESKEVFDFYDIENYLINFYPKNKAKFDVELRVKVKEKTELLSFILYNGFEIISIRDEGDKEINFERDEDFLNVNLNEPLKKDEKITLKISYEGYSGKEFFINDKGVNLSSRFPYIPTNKIGNVMDVNGFSSFFDLSTKSNYEVIVHDDKDFYSNLETVGKNHFKGERDGLFLLSGNNIKSYKEDGVNYYNGILYRAYSDDPSNITKMKDIYENSINWINKVIYQKEEEKIKNFFLLYHNDIDTVDIFNHSIILYSEVNSNLKELDIIKDILSKKLNNINGENQERFLIINAIFLESIDYFYSNNIEFNNDKLGMLYDENYKKSYENYLITLEKIKDEEKENFFREFFQLCLKEINFNDFNQFIEKYN